MVEEKLMFCLIFHNKEFFQITGARVEKGQGLIEYALLILLLAMVVIATLWLLRGQITISYQFVTDRLGEVIN